MKLHPGCVICKKKNIAQSDIIDEETGKIRIRKGEFAINCSGIPADPEEHLIEITPPALVKAIGEPAIRKMARLNDPVLWAEDNVKVHDPELGKRVPWKPRGATPENIEKYNLTEDAIYYQDLMVRCTAKRALYRIGRRSGKTWGIVIRALHRLYVQENYTILVIAPALPQLDIIFGTMAEFIYSSPSLTSDNVRVVKAPNREIQLPNGSVIRGFVSGSESIRGQKADEIIIDEADYLTTTDFSSISAILTDHKDTRFVVSSTPSGAREQFFKWDKDPKFRSFHFPSMCRPNWTEEMEIEMKKENPGNKYVHEFLADYGELEAGVFQHSFVDEALIGGNYDYETQTYESSWIYTIGVDWNPVNGTEIYVVGANTLTDDSKIYKVVDHGQVFREGNTQIAACNEIIRLNRRWRPAHIFVDRGAGSTQIEYLNQFGHQAANGSVDRRLESIVEAVDFGSKVEIRNPATQKLEKVYAKPAVVENAVRMFESGQIQLCNKDVELIRQLKGYQVEKIGHTRPVYGMISDEISDHRLDAFMLALFAFMMKFSKFGIPITVPNVGFAGFFKDEADEKRRKEIAIVRQIETKEKELDEKGLIPGKERVSVVKEGTLLDFGRFKAIKADIESKSKLGRGPISRPNINISRGGYGTKRISVR